MSARAGADARHGPRPQRTPGGVAGGGKPPAPGAPGGWPLRGVVLSALGALALGGGPTGGVAGVALVGLLAPPPPLPSRAWPFLHGAVLLGAGIVLVGGSTIPAFAVLSAWLLVHQAWTARSAESVRVALLLATLLLLLGCVQSASPWLAPLFVAYVGLLPVALLRAQLHGAGARPARGLEVGIALFTVAAAAGLFVALPRLDGGYLGRGGQARMPDEVRLGGDGLGSDDLAEVLRVRVSDETGRPVAGPFYVRGRALDAFDGARWTSSVPPGPPTPAAWNRRAELRVVPLAGNLLFSVGEPRRFEGIAVRRVGNQTFEHAVPGAGVSYVALGWEAPLGGIPVDDGPPALLALPELDPRVVSLAWSVAGEEADAAIVAAALSSHLREGYAYVEDPPDPTGDPLAEFLFERRTGHCEYFASALTVLLRVRGIPARVATGFYSGELADDGTIVVRRGHAHAWTEVRTATGWAALDATPQDGLPAPDGGGWGGRLSLLVAGWYREVVDYDMNAQIVSYGRLGAPLLAGSGRDASPMASGLVGMVVAAVGTIVGLGVLRGVVLVVASGRVGRRARSDVGAALVSEARSVVRARGWDLPDALPPLEAADWLEARVEGAGAPLRELGERVYAARYGGAPLDVARVRACVEALRTVLRTRARGPVGSTGVPSPADGSRAAG